MVKNITKRLLPAVLQYAWLSVKVPQSQVQVLQENCVQRFRREEGIWAKISEREAVVRF